MLKTDQRRIIINSNFTAKMLCAYEAPKHVAEDGAMQEALLELIEEAAVAAIPDGWDYERMTVYAQRLWDESLLGKKYTAGWPQVDQVRKAGQAIVDDMTTHDVPALPPMTDQVPEHFPQFYANMAQIMAKPIEDDAWMQARKAAWMRQTGKEWPLEV